MAKRVAIVGSRGFPNLDQVREYVRSLPPDTVVVSGGAPGVDRVAENEAKRIGLETLIFPADWSQGRGAGYARNRDIVGNSDELVAFWDGESRGTLHSVGLARERGIPVRIYGPTEP